MIVIDANALVALLNPMHVFHDRSEELFLEHADEQKLVSWFTMLQALAHPAKANQAEVFAQRVHSLGIEVALPAADDDLIRVANTSAASGLPIPDAAVLDLATTRRLPVLTFDPALTEAARQAGLDVIT